MVGSVDHLPLHLWSLLWKCRLFFGTQDCSKLSQLASVAAPLSSKHQRVKSHGSPFWHCCCCFHSYCRGNIYLVCCELGKVSIRVWVPASRRRRSALCRLVPAAVTGARSPGFLGFILAHCPQSRTFNFAHAAILQVTTMRNHVITSYNGRHKLS